MNNQAPRLSPLFRSDTQAGILARVLFNPDRSYTTADLSRAVGSSYATTHREVQRLVSLGLFRQEAVGRAIRVSADTSDPAFEHVLGLLRLSYGPTAVLPRVLGGVTGIIEAHIYGSWAARRLGEPGSPPRDIDVLVIGDPPRSAIHDAADAAESALGREVNIRIVSPEEWEAGEDLFIQTVRERPMQRLTLQAESE